MTAREKREKEQREEEQRQQEAAEQQERESNDPPVPSDPLAGAVGGEPAPVRTSPDSEAQTSPHKLRDALGTPTQGSPSGVDRRTVANRSTRTHGVDKPAYTGPERRKT